ncbi:MAG: YibE/F family protein [Acidimicrobiales bacterium]
MGELPPRVRRILLAVIAPLVVATVVGMIVLWPRGSLPQRPPTFGLETTLETARVTSVRLMPCGGSTSQVAPTCQAAEVEVTSGPDKGTTAALELSTGAASPDLERGDPILVGRSPDPVLGTIYSFADYQRRAPLILLALLFTVVVVAVGRLKGLTALIGLAITFVVLVKFVLPAILQGESPLLVAVVGSAAVMLVIMYLAHGVNGQTTVAVLGTLASLILIAVLSALFVEIGRIVNLGSEEATLLQTSAAQVNLRGLILGGIIIGSLGVLNDVTVTQASAVWALRATDPTASVGALYRSAMRIGRDHIASVVDTLVLAYAGASLPLLLLFTLASRPVGDILTGALVAEEIVRTLVGSIGLVLSVPITTGLAAVVATQAGVTDKAGGAPAGRGLRSE